MQTTRLGRLGTLQPNEAIQVSINVTDTESPRIPLSHFKPKP